VEIGILSVPVCGRHLLQGTRFPNRLDAEPGRLMDLTTMGPSCSCLPVPPAILVVGLDIGGSNRIQGIQCVTVLPDYPKSRSALATDLDS
jgi:hypothetical protein